MKVPFFSIALPTYNRASDLRFAIKCILRQNFSDYEIVVSDNSATDETQTVVKEFKNSKIKYFKNSKNVGMLGNQKLAIERSQGRYVFLHGDDDFLPFVGSLRDVHKQICTYNPGYVRLNYVSLALDNAHLFTYKVYKQFTKNTYVPPKLPDSDVLSFLVNSDHYFFSGIIFKNEIPKAVKIVNADPSPWIHVLFYLTKKYGGYFITHPHVVARWSRRTKKIEDHGFYIPIKGKLKAEGYFEVIKKLVDKKTYHAFLHRELITIYINLFPAIKTSVGRERMLEIAERIRVLDPTLGRSFLYWKNFLLTLLIPRWMLVYIREVFLFFYVRNSKVQDEQKIKKALKTLGFFADRYNAGR